MILDSWEGLVDALRERTPNRPDIAEMHLAVAEQIRFEDEQGAIDYLKNALEKIGGEE